MEALKYWAQTQGVTLASTILKTVIIAVIGILIIRIVMRIINKALEKSQFEKAAFSLIKTLARTVMSVLLALMLASSLGIDVTGVVALASEKKKLVAPAGSGERFAASKRGSSGVRINCERIRSPNAMKKW